MRGRVHEVLAHVDEAGSGSGFAALLARLIGGEILWLTEESVGRRTGTLYPSGLAAIGTNPGQLIIGVLPDATSVLRAAVDGLRCTALGGVVITLVGNPDVLTLTTSRRLTLAAEKSGITAILLRLGGNAAPSAAQTRWHVAAAPSVPLVAGAPGYPAWDIELLRQRGRPDGGRWRVEWNREQGKLRDWSARDSTTFPGLVAAVSANRSADDGTPLCQIG